MTTRGFAFLVLTIATLAALPGREAHASSLPAAEGSEHGRFGLGLGTGSAWRPGASLAVDWPVGDGMSLGGALASTFAGATTVDLRGVYRFVEGSRETPAIAGIVGLWGLIGGGSDPRFSWGAPLAPSVGFGLAYGPLDKLMLRLNLAYSPFYAYGTEQLGFIGGPPGSGLEAAYVLWPGVEVTAGLNGNGDMVGLAYVF